MDFLKNLYITHVDVCDISFYKKIVKIYIFLDFYKKLIKNYKLILICIFCLLKVYTRLINFCSKI